MDSYEPGAHSFVLKIWIEESGDAAIPTKWRGHITHVPSGQRRYFEALEEIIHFVQPYLEEMGVQFAPRQGLPQRWLKCLRHRLTR
ncbi:hypothetical protein FKZ61_018020 [Litorilinea aerophila]|uniref:Uncharacterized protein n=1 Tax=Litorilinea aerophila TaxID=1204385 RepID=A0A540VBW6_9CHLR|nr:hypothetical protein [Litorilinea aerophila]MCC9077998.1 hypothetical protein [Litorilinea aerophila]OUC09074.1 hypothetical protein RY27_05115 [Litorilinea aerophila]GIV76645.1 MAG: hypothetical protein KatS3mg050_1039 [Litorilinea sp.]